MFDKIKARLFAAMYMLFANVRGMASAAGVGATLIGISIALIVASAILPTAIVDITNTTNYTGAPPAVLTLVPILGIIVVASVAFMLYRRLAGGQ